MPNSDAPPVANLAKDTAVKPLLSTPGLYTAELSDRWNLLGPSGGVLMAMLLRAMHAQLGDPGLRLLSAATTFCAPVSPGCLAIRVEVLRSSGTATHVRASLASMNRPGPGLEVQATFVRSRSGPDIRAAQFPEVPMPDNAQDISDALGQIHIGGAPMSFFRNFEIRLADGTPWWFPERRPGPARCALWMRYREPQQDARGLFDRFAVPPLTDTMPAAIWQTHAPDQPLFHVSTLDCRIHFLNDTRSEWFLSLVQSRCAQNGYATAEIDVWSEQRTLIACGAGTLLLRRMRRSPR